MDGSGRRSAPRRRDPPRACRFPASTTSTTRSRPSRRRCELGVAPERIAAALARDAGGLRPGRDDRGRRQAGLDPADQEPRRRQRGPAHAAPGGRRASRIDLWIALNDRIADGRDVSWVWDADFELLAAPSARRLRRHPGAGDGAAAEVRGLAGGARSRSCPRSGPSLDAARRRRSGAASSPFPPTRRCWSCASCSPTAASPRSSGDEHERRLAIWHDVECGAYAADLGSGRSSPTRCRRPGPGARLRHRPASPCTSPARGHRVIGLDHDPELVAALARARDAGLPVADAADARELRLLETASRWRWRRCSCCSCSPTRAERLACLASVAAQLRPGGRVAAAIVEGMPRARRGAAAAARRARGRRLGLLQPAAGGRRRAAARSSSAGCARRSPRPVS